MDIVLRATFVSWFIWLLLRGTGKRSLSELTPLDLLVVVILGDLVQPGITHEDLSVAGGLLAASTFVGWTLVADLVARRSSAGSRVLSGQPALLMRDGEVLWNALSQEGLSFDDLVEAARENGIGDLREVRFAVLEVDGTLSFVSR